MLKLKEWITTTSLAVIALSLGVLAIQSLTTPAQAQRPEWTLNNVIMCETDWNPNPHYGTCYLRVKVVQ